MTRSKEQIKEQHAAELGSVVCEANNCAERLLEVLAEEQAALSSVDVALIDSCGQKKTECIAQLENLERERLDICRMLSLADHDIEDFLMQYNKGLGHPGWKRFLGNMYRCHEANAINGNITRLRRRHVERALMVLRGRATDHPGLYGPNGLDEADKVSSLGRA